MPRLTKHDATNLARRFGFPLGADFHSLSSGVVDAITHAADEWKYKKPRSANGSRARYFYAYLNRVK